MAFTASQSQRLYLSQRIELAIHKAARIDPRAEKDRVHNAMTWCRNQRDTNLNRRRFRDRTSSARPTAALHGAEASATGENLVMCHDTAAERVPAFGELLYQRGWFMIRGVNGNILGRLGRGDGVEDGNLPEHFPVKK